jgi:hypothetical protein
MKVFTIFAATARALQFQEVSSWQGPLTSDKFDHWESKATTVMLTDKIVLAPEGKDMTGYWAQKYVGISFAANSLVGVRSRRMGVQLRSGS